MLEDIDGPLVFNRISTSTQRNIEILSIKEAETIRGIYLKELGCNFQYTAIASADESRDKFVNSLSS